ncbi:hypothetical protein PRUPE_1G198400 [Prunus persica]|uniref:DUF8040 domain-containing protein n=1 Tax=Prunus persica TaxID=3760 RepID=A0A251R0D7_PRUPE|nr:hypothetical protein PRUPE_1G198400 [Prunus persica]
MQVVEGIHEIVEDDKVFVKAAYVLTERKNREMFVALRQANRQIMWLRKKLRDKLTDKWVMDVLNGHKIRCYEQFRMEKHVFIKLLETLTSAYDLKEVGDIPVVEVLFLIILGHGFTYRMVQERFQHSGETVSKWFGIILDVFCPMASYIISPQDPHFRRVPGKIKVDDRYWPYFKDCIGAIDGTHIPLVMPRARQVLYIERKGITTQSVMVVWNFNICFTFVWAGWESAVHNARIFMEALRRPILKFRHPPTGN